MYLVQLQYIETSKLIPPIHFDISYLKNYLYKIIYYFKNIEKILINCLILFLFLLLLFHLII